jgi:hypothetical protein
VTWAAVALMAVAGLLALALAVVVGSLARTLGALQTAVDELNREAIPLLADLRRGASQASADLERVDDLVGAAESVTRTVDGASRLAYLTFSNPVVKLLAFGSGLSRARRRFRHRGAGGAPRGGRGTGGAPRGDGHVTGR